MCIYICVYIYVYIYIYIYIYTHMMKITAYGQLVPVGTIRLSSRYHYGIYGDIASPSSSSSPPFHCPPSKTFPAFPPLRASVRLAYGGGLPFRTGYSPDPPPHDYTAPPSFVEGRATFNLLPDMMVTLETSHEDTSPSNADAPQNTETKRRRIQYIQPTRHATEIQRRGTYIYIYYRYIYIGFAV
jgi:hypothetical protein